MIIVNFEDFLKWHNITLRIVKLPCHIKGFAYYDGSNYLVLLNHGCSYYQMQTTLIHELIHVLENHLSCYKGYEDKCEKETHIIINNIKKEFLTNITY